MEPVTNENPPVSEPQAAQPMRRRTVWLVVVLGLVVALIVLLAIGVQPRSSELLQGNPAPDFDLTAFNGEFEGQRFGLADLRGKPIVLNMWASWCVECEREAPVLEQAWRDYRAQGVWLIGVDYLDTDTAGMEYLKRFNITYPNGPDIGSRIYHDYRSTGVPETFFIDRHGIVQHVQIGPIGRQQLYELLDRLSVED